MFGFEDSGLGGNQNLTSTHGLFVFEEVQLSTVHQPEHQDNIILVPVFTEVYYIGEHILNMYLNV